MAVDNIARAMAAQSINRELTEFGAGVIPDMIRNALLNMCYPVGAIYMSTVDTSPETFLGGTWKRYGSGRTLVSVDANDVDFNAAGKTGGEKEHALTVAEMPKHTHNQKIQYDNQNRDMADLVSDTSDTGSAKMWSMSGIYSSHIALITGETGASQPHNNMPPYTTCYMWVRTA